jgi:hypothetical protein
MNKIKIKKNRIKFLASQEYKDSEEKAQLCLPQVTYLGVVFKGQTLSLSHEQIIPTHWVG